MTGKTGFLLRQGIENPVALSVNLVAGGTGQVFTLMGTAEPGQAPPGFMTAQAYLVLFVHRRRGAGSEGDRGIAVLAPALGACMFLAGPMAGFALKIRKRCCGVGLRSVLGIKYRDGGFFRTFTVTQNTGVCAAAGIVLARRDNRQQQ